jgi:hypothetical protein
MPVAAALPVVPPGPPDMQADACDQEIEALLSQFTPRVDPAEKPLPPDRKRNRAAKRRRKRTGNPDTAGWSWTRN